MMPQTFFRDANGEEIHNIAPAAAAALVLESDPKCWIGETGDAMFVHVADDGIESHLLLYFVKDYGFSIDWFRAYETRLTAISGHQKNQVAIVVGGSRFSRPVKAFVSPTEASSIIEYFLQTGSTLKEQLWAATSTI
jgi:hypothetical protein